MRSKVKVGKVKVGVLFLLSESGCPFSYFPFSYFFSFFLLFTFWRFRLPAKTLRRLRDATGICGANVANQSREERASAGFALLALIH